jgi:hypothetical protein
MILLKIPNKYVLKLFRSSKNLIIFLKIDEAVWACQKLESIINELDHQITFILLSTVLTWAKTQPNEVQ